MAKSTGSGGSLSAGGAAGSGSGTYQERVANGVPGTDDYAWLNARLQTALTECQSNGSGVFEIPAGDWYISQGFEIPVGTKNLTIRGAGSDKTRIHQTNGAAITNMLMIGTTPASISYANAVWNPWSGVTYTSKAVASAADGESSIALSAGHGFTGTGLYVLRDATTIYNPGTTVSGKGELVKVTNIATNTFTVDKPIHYTYGSTPVLTDVRANSCENIAVEGIFFDGKKWAAGSHTTGQVSYWISAVCVYGLTISDIQAEYFSGHGIGLHLCSQFSLSYIKLRYGPAGSVGGARFVSWDHCVDGTHSSIFTNQDYDNEAVEQVSDTAPNLEIHQGCANLSFTGGGKETGATYGGTLDHHCIGGKNLTITGGTYHNITLGNSQWPQACTNVIMNGVTVLELFTMGSGFTGTITDCRFNVTSFDNIDTDTGYSFGPGGRWVGDVTFDNCIFHSDGPYVYSKVAADAGLSGTMTMNNCQVMTSAGDTYIIKLTGGNHVYADWRFVDSQIDFSQTGFMPNLCVNSEFTIDGCLVNSRSAYAGSNCGSLFYFNAGHDNNTVNIANGTRFYTDAANPSWVNIDGGTGNTVNVGADCHIYATSERSKPLNEQTPRAGL